MPKEIGQTILRIIFFMAIYGVINFICIFRNVYKQAIRKFSIMESIALSIFSSIILPFVIIFRRTKNEH